MLRSFTICLLFLTAALPALAEEIVLRDGTRIVGHMTGITSDKIEVETSYGKVQLNRVDIVTITFADNGSAKAADVAPAKQVLPKLDESLAGTQYINRTGKFALTLPTDWLIDPNLRNSPTTLAGLSSKDKMRFAMVIQEDYPGSMDSYRELTMLGVRRTLSNFEELSRSEATIDGKTALLVFYRGTLQKSNNLPVEFLSAFFQSGKHLHQDLRLVHRAPVPRYAANLRKNRRLLPLLRPHHRRFLQTLTGSRILASAPVL